MTPVVVPDLERLGRKSVIQTETGAMWTVIKYEDDGLVHCCFGCSGGCNGLVFDEITGKAVNPESLPEIDFSSSNQPEISGTRIVAVVKRVEPD